MTNILFGQMAFEEVNTLPVIPTFYNAVVFDDLDNDGDNDAIISGLYTDNSGIIIKINEMYFNNGTGVFTLVSDTPFPSVMDGDIDLGDIDNDGDLDVFMTGDTPSGYIAKLYKNDGLANFTEVAGTIFTPVGGGSFQQFVDVNGDGALDLFVTGDNIDPSQPENTSLYINDGNGNFSEQASGIPDLRYCSFDFADIDEDGDQDLYISGLRFMPIMETIGGLYLNNGNGNFTLTESPFVPVLTTEESSVQFADFDGDGDQDAVLSGLHETGMLTTLYFNDGAGNFTAVTTDILPAGDGAVDVADIDNDGDVDILLSGIVVADYPPETVSTIYVNDGDGNFSLGLSRNYFEWMYEGSAEFVDIDNDGKLDVYIAGRQKSDPSPTGSVLISKLYKNTSILSISEMDISSVRLYPNPTQNIFYIESREPVTKIKIYSIDGKLIQEIEEGHFYGKIDLQNEPSGVYFINIQSGKNEVTKKIVKK